MKELEIFKNEEFGAIRTILVDEKPYFCGTDVAKALGYAKPNNAISTHCRATLKQGIPISGKIQEVWTIFVLENLHMKLHMEPRRNRQLLLLVRDRFILLKSYEKKWNYCRDYVHGESSVPTSDGAGY